MPHAFVIEKVVEVGERFMAVEADHRRNHFSERGQFVNGNWPIVHFEVAQKLIAFELVFYFVLEIQVV